MPTTTPARPARRLRPLRPLRSLKLLRPLALTPLLAGALLLGTGGAPPGGSAGSASSVASSPGSTALPRDATAAPASAAGVDAQSAYAVALRFQGLRLTAAQAGKWYRWGAAGPYYFDCSGLVYYVFHTRLYRNLPRTANAQRLATIPISKAYVLPGDLVFFMSGGWAYHVGVYAGNGYVWHAPRPGQRVQLSRLWTTAWVAGRVR